MKDHELAAVAASALLGSLAVFQVLLASGAPLGRAAWGGFHRVLPSKLRWASAAAVPVLFIAGWVVLARAGLVQPGAEPPTVRILAWVFTAYFTFNTAMNAASESAAEKWVMTPVSTALASCCALVACARV